MTAVGDPAKGSKRNLVEIHTAVFLFGFAGLFSRWVDLPSSIIVLGRTLFATIFLLFFSIFFKFSFSIKRRLEIMAFIFCGILLAAHWIAFFQSIKVSNVAIGLISYSTFPVFVVLTEPFVFKERFQPANLTAALITIAGIYLIIPEFSWDNRITQGVGWGLFSGFSFALLSLINRKLRQKYTGYMIAFYQNMIAFLVLVPFWIHLRPAVSGKNLLLLIVLGVFCTALAHSLFIKGLSNVKAQTASIIATLEPVYGILLACLLLDEIPALKTVGGGLIVLCAVLWVSLRKNR